MSAWQIKSYHDFCDPIWLRCPLSIERGLFPGGKKKSKRDLGVLRGPEKAYSTTRKQPPRVPGLQVRLVLWTDIAASPHGTLSRTEEDTARSKLWWWRHHSQPASASHGAGCVPGLCWALQLSRECFSLPQQWGRYLQLLQHGSQKYRKKNFAKMSKSGKWCN